MSVPMSTGGFTQIRPAGGGPPYAPHRDLLNCFSHIARRAAYLLAPEYREEWVQKFLADTNTSDDDLNEAAKSLATFINNCTAAGCDTPVDALEKSDFLSLPVPAQLLILARVGQVTMAMFHASARDALQQDSKPIGFDQFMSEIDSMAKAIKANKVENK